MRRFSRYLRTRVRTAVAQVIRPAGLLALAATITLVGGAISGTTWLIVVGSVSFGLALMAVITRQHSTWVRLSDVNSGPVPIAPVAPEQLAPSAETDHSEAQMRAALALIDGGSSSDPLVTVVVPVYNEERFLSDCLESLIAQSWTSWRCIVVDDASTDTSLSLARSFANRDSRISVVRHYVNSGLPASRNTGLRLAETKWITFLDSDDFLLADNLKDRLSAAFAVQDPYVAGVYSGVQQYPEEITLADLPASLPWNPPTFHDYLSSRGECPFNAHAPMLLTEIVRQFGGFDEAMLQGAEDWKLWLRIMRAGFHFVPSQSITAIYRQKRRSMVRSMPSGHLEEADQMLASIHRPLDHDAAVESGPFPYLDPISTYDQKLAITKRVIGYAGLASLAEEPAEWEETLKKLPDQLPPGWDRHIDVERIIDESFRRALAVDRSTFRALRPGLETKIEAIREAIDERVAPLNSPPPIPNANDHSLIVFLPTNAQQVDVMSQSAGSVTAPFRFVTTERWTGNQGVVAGLKAAEVPYESLHSFMASGTKTQTLVMGHPSDGPSYSFAQELAGQGVDVITIDSIVDQIDEGPEPVGRLVDPDSLLDALGAAADTVAAKTSSPEVWRTITLVGSTEEAGTGPDVRAIARFRNRHIGERVFIIGNGPSLNKIDLTKMAEEYTIAVNGIFLAREQMSFSPTYYVVEDTSVMKENTQAIIEYPADQKFFPTIYRDLVPPAENVAFFQMNRGFYAQESPHYCVPRFSVDAPQTMFSGQSVTIINLQLAYYLGFTEVVLVGMDFSYTIPDSAERSGDIIRSTQDDPNHFHPDYFGKGKTWKDPKLDRVLANYELAKVMYEAAGRRIVNATPGGNLHLFDRVEYDSLFRMEG